MSNGWIHEPIIIDIDGAEFDILTLVTCFTRLLYAIKPIANGPKPPGVKRKEWQELQATLVRIRKGIL